MEIERKFLLAALPAGLEDSPGAAIEQGYLAFSDDGTEVRVRSKGGKHFLAVKHGGGLSRTEVELPVSAEQFDALWPLTEGWRVSKVRRELPGPGGVTVEVDVYGGHLTGLWVAEVEFPDEAAAHAFTPPEWFGREITGDPAYRNRTVARHGLPQGA